MELADMRDLGSRAERRAGSTPVTRTSVRRSKHRSVSAMRRKLHYVSSFFLLNCDPLRWARSLVFALAPLLLLSESNPLRWALSRFLCSAAPPFQIEPAALGFDLVFAFCFQLAASISDICISLNGLAPLSTEMIRNISSAVFCPVLAVLFTSRSKKWRSGITPSFDKSKPPKGYASGGFYNAYKE